MKRPTLKTPRGLGWVRPSTPPDPELLLNEAADRARYHGGQGEHRQARQAHAEWMAMASMELACFHAHRREVWP